MTAPERIWIAGRYDVCGQYYEEAVEAEGEHGGTAIPYVQESEVTALLADRDRLADEVERLREALADATEWKSMNSAPTDGRHVIVAVQTKSSFVYSVEGAFMNGRWMNAFDIAEAPLCWRHKPLIPEVFLPWTEEFAAEALRKGGAA